MSSPQLTVEVQNQLRTANALNLELTAVRAAKLQVLADMEKSGTGLVR
jgi:hypothetical protein